MNISLEEYKKNGYVVIPDAIPEHMVMKVRGIAMGLKQRMSAQKLFGTKKDFGVPTYWKGIDMASVLDPQLFELYTQPFMQELSAALLETREVYHFNDQVVCKMPDEDFVFDAHCDNQYGPNPELASQGIFKTVTCCWVIDDLTPENGAIGFLNSSTGQWETPYVRSGTIMAWDGNTVHASGKNNSGNARIVWLLIYSNAEVAAIPSASDIFTRFHKGKFTI